MTKILQQISNQMQPAVYKQQGNVAYVHNPAPESKFLDIVSFDGTEGKT